MPPAGHSPGRLWRHTSLAALGGLLALGGLACIFGPAIPVEETPRNMPPFISTDFIAPNRSTVTIVRSGPQVTFSLNQLFDMNENEELEITWYSPHVFGGTILQEDLAGPDPNNRTLFRGVFHRYTGSSYVLDPCDPRWADGQRHTLQVFVTDGKLIIPGGEPVVSEGAFVDVISWTIEFTDECPQF